MCLNIDKIGMFLKLLPEGFAVDHIKWWAGHCAQFLNLSHLIQDILSIPGVFLLFALNYSSDVFKGSAVAVECIFSGAHNTIAL
jgi:hypothetical protein